MSPLQIRAWIFTPNRYARSQATVLARESLGISCIVQFRSKSQALDSFQILLTPFSSLQQCSEGACHGVCHSPSCTQLCDAGNCSMECKGLRCRQNCTAGGCQMTCPDNAEICEQHCAAQNCTVTRAATEIGGHVLTQSSMEDNGIHFERKRTKPNSGSWSLSRLNERLYEVTLCAIAIALAY